MSKKIMLFVFALALSMSLEVNAASVESKNIIDCGMMQSYSFPLPEDVYPNPYNPYEDLKVPISVSHLGDKYFIVDCYHNQILYSDRLETGINGWKVMARELNLPHGIAYDGKYYVILDTDNNRVLIYEWVRGGFRKTQGFDNIGIRPHYIKYDVIEDAFYVWSSMTGDMYIFKTDPLINKVCLKEIRHISELENHYVRSFTMMDDYIMFPSGSNMYAMLVKKDTFEVVERYPVHEDISGMAQIFKIGNYWYASISTNYYGNQNYSKFIRTTDLASLKENVYEDITYLFPNMDIPYYMEQIGGYYYITNHGTNSFIYAFQVEADNIYNVRCCKRK